MTINDAMKALAEKLDPNRPDVKYFTEIGHKSPLGFWQTYDDHNYNAQWNPIDFLHSEDASARLLDAMQAAGNMVLHGANGWGCEVFRITEDGIHRATITNGIRHHADRKTAVFLAALAWKGIERPEGL